MGHLHPLLIVTDESPRSRNGLTSVTLAIESCFDYYLSFAAQNNGDSWGGQMIRLIYKLYCS